MLSFMVSRKGHYLCEGTQNILFSNHATVYKVISIAKKAYSKISQNVDFCNVLAHFIYDNSFKL